MPQLSASEFSLVYNAFSFTFAAMFATFIFLVLSRPNVAPKYRNALTLSALVVAIAGYHYLRIFESWQAAFVVNDQGAYVASGKPFNDAYRYIDWLLTVPLLVAELVAVMTIAKGKGWLTFRLATAAALMIILGYPGEIATTLDSNGNPIVDTGARALWGLFSTVPFIYILYELFVGLGPAIQKETGEVRVLLRNIRLLLFATWGFYPIVYLIPILSGGAQMTAGVLLAVQVGYCIADVAAKCGYGIMIYAIAKAKTDAEPEAMKIGAAAAVAGD
ncbi:MAG: bacteriorhodopsin-like [Anaerolineae bacterium]|nr:bacteriorhodopsin-like [Anaerolineae bacterium]MDW8299289.1 bacteriorhodopsin-like [Anaerolineae bacterium]